MAFHEVCRARRHDNPAFRHQSGRPETDLRQFHDVCRARGQDARTLRHRNGSAEYIGDISRGLMYGYKTPLLSRIEAGTRRRTDDTSRGVRARRQDSLTSPDRSRNVETD